MTYAISFRHQLWGGDTYELAAEVGSTEREDREPEEQEPVPCTVASLGEFGQLHGRVRLPSGRLVTCAVRSAATDDWLAGIGAEAFRGVPFSLGLVGWNVSGLTGASTLGGIMPEKRGVGCRLPRGGVLHYGAVNG